MKNCLNLRNHPLEKEGSLEEAPLPSPLFLLVANWKVDRLQMDLAQDQLSDDV